MKWLLYEPKTAGKKLANNIYMLMNMGLIPTSFYNTYDTLSQQASWEHTLTVS